MGRKLQFTVRGAKLYNKATPYCVCTLLDSQGGLISSQVQKTKVVQTSCTNPVWEQLLEFDVSTDFHGFKLECYDKRKLRADKLIGQVTLKVNPETFYEQEIMDEWFPLKHKEQKGELQLRVQCKGRDAPSRTNSNVTPTTTTTTTTPATTNTTNPSSSSSSSSSNRNSTQMDIDTPAVITTPASTTTTTTTTTTSSSLSSSSTKDSLAPDTSSLDMTKSPSWEHPTTSENLLKKSYVIIEDDFNPTDSPPSSQQDDSDSVSSPLSSGRSKLTTSFKPTPDHSEEEEEDEDEEMEDDVEEQYDEDEEEDVDYQNDKEYPQYYGDDNWDAIDEEEEAAVKPKSLSASGIFQARESKINKVKDILGVPSHIAQALLQHYQWDEEKFLMRFLENPTGIYKEAKIEAPKENKDGANNVGEIMCSVCFEDNQEDITALACNHYFCNDCWKTHIEVGMKEGRSLDITCMHHKCKELMPDYIVRKVVDLETFKKYSAFLSKGFVENNANMKCFLCSEDAHTPATCSMMKEWAKKCADDSETYNWIAANTKDCPQKNCGVPIEKNDGCFMMTCQKCRFQFCWLCCESWASHNDHFKCNKYNEGKLENKPTWLDGRSNTDARQALDRYLFYYNRYINHLSSLKFEDVSREKARNMMEKLQKSGTHSYIDVQFIEAALNQLLENRRTLKNTYVYAFYQADPLKKDLFEFSQADLEKITEKIAQLLKETNEETLIASSATVKSMTQVAQRSLSNLLYDENL